jgi:hypothetical protein
MTQKKYLDIKEFVILYEEFIKITTWSKEKHKKKEILQKFLSKHHSINISIKPNSKYNLCDKTNSFSIIKVPLNKLGKLYSYRGRTILAFCSSYAWGGWSHYSNEIYQLKEIPTSEYKQLLKKKFQNFYVYKDLE